MSSRPAQATTVSPCQKGKGKALNKREREREGREKRRGEEERRGGEGRGILMLTEVPESSC
jgi:hypothetical protein